MMSSLSSRLPLISTQIKILRRVNSAITVIVLYLLYVLAKTTVENGKPLDDGGGDTSIGFWGEKTATVNWCEPDYVYTTYIAEFFNSMSSLFMVFTGGFGVYMHWKTAEPRFLVGFLFAIVVGLGSAAFHGTLKHSMQHLDELPMVWSNVVFVYIVFTSHDPPGTNRVPWAWFALFAAIAMTAAVLIFDTEDQNVFLFCYSSMNLVIVWASRRHLAPSEAEINELRRRERGGPQTRSLRRAQDKLSPSSFLWGSSYAHLIFNETALFCFGMGFTCWLIDRSYCPSVVSFHLHSFWHLGAGTSRERRRHHRIHLVSPNTSFASP